MLDPERNSAEEVVTQVRRLRRRQVLQAKEWRPSANVK